ncbi:hypothetical protein MKZ38_009023 [Zalerion maritima]|uniref:Uncharacterized protein n=1 Tax=Zalerion maritima TaxID=339359 RepID=A0AAD5RVP3_9PEZI|nr:hypothetical protein MKZ38_009023 [Zalerion maritima]
MYRPPRLCPPGTDIFELRRDLEQAIETQDRHFLGDERSMNDVIKGCAYTISQHSPCLSTRLDLDKFFVMACQATKEGCSYFPAAANPDDDEETKRLKRQRTGLLFYIIIYFLEWHFELHHINPEPFGMSVISSFNKQKGADPPGSLHKYERVTRVNLDRVHECLTNKELPEGIQDAWLSDTPLEKGRRYFNEVLSAYKVEKEFNHIENAYRVACQKVCRAFSANPGFPTNSTYPVDVGLNAVRRAKAKMDLRGKRIFLNRSRWNKDQATVHPESAETDEEWKLDPDHVNHLAKFGIPKADGGSRKGTLLSPVTTKSDEELRGDGSSSSQATIPDATAPTTTETASGGDDAGEKSAGSVTATDVRSDSGAISNYHAGKGNGGLSPRKRGRSDEPTGTQSPKKRKADLKSG